MREGGGDVKIKGMACLRLCGASMSPGVEVLAAFMPQIYGAQVSSDNEICEYCSVVLTARVLSSGYI